MFQDPESRREEQRKYGVFYDDDYDYLQHLKDVNELYEVHPVEYNPRVESSVEENEQVQNYVEEILGLFNRNN